MKATSADRSEEREPTGARNQKVASHIRTRKIKDVTPGFNKCYGAFCHMSGEKKNESCYSLSFLGFSAAARAYPRVNWHGGNEKAACEDQWVKNGLIGNNLFLADVRDLVGHFFLMCRVFF